jgi:hypothetical protein
MSERVRVSRDFAALTVPGALGATWSWEFSIAPLDPNEFMIPHINCPRIFQPGEGCVVAVAFNPLTLGPKEGHVSIEALNGEPPEARRRASPLRTRATSI